MPIHGTVDLEGQMIGIICLIGVLLIGFVAIAVCIVGGREDE